MIVRQWVCDGCALNHRFKAERSMSAAVGLTSARTLAFECHHSLVIIGWFVCILEMLSSSEMIGTRPILVLLSPSLIIVRN